MLEDTEGAIKNEQSREAVNIGYKRRTQTKQKHNTTQYVFGTTIRFICAVISKRVEITKRKWISYLFSLPCSERSIEVNCKVYN